MEPSNAVRRIGPGIPYVDGSERHLLELLRGVVDVTSGSDELDSHIVDWVTRYHLSHQRSNLLRPLEIAPGTRVLDVGAGTGGLARYLGERGAEVLALEGNIARAEVTAERCRDLDGVEVVCGSIDDLDEADQFDLITVIGVLEYSEAEIGGAAGAPALLASVRRRLRPGGAMALAIENQLGLKYLLGGAEDHLGEPWVGLEDYPGPPGVRTWPRRQLAAMLHEQGFEGQRWMAPFPDYKLPTVVLHEAAYLQPDAELLIDQLVLRPVAFLDSLPARVADARAAHRVLVRAGLGPDVSSSFLVVAGPDEDAVERFVPGDLLAWLFGGHRRSPWRRVRALTVERRVLCDGDAGLRSEAWLSQDPGGSRPFEAGRTLGQDIDDALRACDVDGLQELVQRWWAELESRAQPAPERAPDSAWAHPYLPPWSTRVLPADHLDVGPSNFVDRDGDLVFVDDEWRASGPIDLVLAAVRSLWLLSNEVVTSGIHHPWEVGVTVGEVFDRLVGMLPLEVSPADFDAFTDAEVAMQVIVAGGDADEIRRALLDGSLSSLASGLDLADRRELDELRTVVPALDARASAAESERDALAAERVHLAERAALQADVLRRQATVVGYVRGRLARWDRLRRLVHRIRGSASR